MDRNSVIGLLLIGALFVGFIFYQNSISENQKEKYFEENVNRGDSLSKRADVLFIEGKQAFEKSLVDSLKKDSLILAASEILPKARSKFEEAITSYSRALKAKKDEKQPTEMITMLTKKQIEIDSLLKIITPVADSMPVKTDTISSGKEVTVSNDSVAKPALIAPMFTENKKVVSDTFILENSKVKATILSKGAKLESVELTEFKKHPKHEDTRLILFEGDSNVFDLRYFIDRKDVSTKNKVFETKGVIEKADGSKEITLLLYADTLKKKYIEFRYSLPSDGYMMDFEISFNGMKAMMTQGAPVVLNWKMTLPSLEKGYINEDSYCTAYFKANEDVDYLSETSSEDSEEINYKVDWIAFKHQFFSTVIIAKNQFESATISSVKLDDPKENFLKTITASMTLPEPGDGKTSIPFNIYFGPNKYNILSDQGEGLDLEQMIPLGWSFFLMEWINRFAVIPVFNFLEVYIGNYGIIILILTILLKVVLFPLTYKSYLSTAKMKVVKPQLDKALEKIPKEKMQERQQATMAFYKKVGVNPLGGCLPMVVQFPILISMFRFFPASFELRQQPFLWADDLSAYDSVASLPFEIPMYGAHISLFTLLMTISTIIYTRMNMQMNTGPQMPGMKVMMYLFPIMFLFFLNNYSSGLSYYYLVANLITFAQMWAIRRFLVDDNKILDKLEANKKKPVTKSKFQLKLEEMQKRNAKK